MFNRRNKKRKMFLNGLEIKKDGIKKRWRRKRKDGKEKAEEKEKEKKSVRKKNSYP